MKKKLIDILQKFCPNNVYLQGTINADTAYPKEFITFWTNYTDDIAFYNNEVTATEWNFSVIYYSEDPKQVEEKPIEIIKALKQAGFIPQGKGSDIPSDKPTHTGWAMDFIYKETIKEA